MKKILNIVLISIVLVTFILPSTHSCAIEEAFFEISELEVSKNDKIEMIINLNQIKYNKFLFELKASEDIENVEIGGNEITDNTDKITDAGLEVEKSGNEISIELRSFFHGMMGYLLTAFLLAASGIYFLALNLGYGLTDFGYYTLYRTIFMLLLYFPVLAMRSLAEERRARTDQLLLTSPVSVWGIVVGKYLALCTVFTLPCLADGIMIVVLWLLGGTASACGANFAALLCYFLLGCAAIAVCEFCSGLTENQIIAAVMGFSALLVAYMMPSLRSMFNAGSAVALVVFTALSAGASLAVGLRTRSFTLGCFCFAALCAGLSALFLLRSAWLTEAFSAVLSALCLFAPFEEFVNNSFSIPTLVYYLTVTVLFLFFTAQGIEKRRWN